MDYSYPGPGSGGRASPEACFTQVNAQPRGYDLPRPYWTEATESAVGPIVATKLHVPELLAGRVSRPSLVAELRDGAGVRLVLVSAPAGAGKTTVLASWRADPAEQRPFAWLSLDSRDNDPVRFWTYVLAALRTVAPDLGAGVDDALLSAAGDLTELALPLLVNALTSVPEPIVLALDDYHAISNADVHQSMDFLIDHLPRTVQVAVAGRSDPPLALARLRASAELLEVRVGRSAAKHRRDHGVAQWVAAAVFTMADLGGMLPEGPASLPARVLLALGMTGGGALGSGALVQGLSRGLTKTVRRGQRVNLVRLGGGVASGLAAVLWLSGAGPSGPGTGNGTPGTDDKGKETAHSKGDEKKAPRRGRHEPNLPRRPRRLANRGAEQERGEGVAGREGRRGGAVVSRDVAGREKEGLSLDELVDRVAKTKPPPPQVVLISYDEDSGVSDVTAAKIRLMRIAEDLMRIRDSDHVPLPRQQKPPIP